MAPYLHHFNLLQTISLLYSLITFTCTGSSLKHDDDCSALFQFKQSIIHQNDVGCAASWFQTFDSWKPTRNASDAGFDCCSWYGVECSKNNEYGHVVGLDLSESFLCGHIKPSSTLFSLVHLQRLNLALNDFYESQIPSEIARLKQLRSLNLSNSGFIGQIPNEISQLMKLSSLDLSLNPLKLQSPDGLKNLVQNLTGLEKLSLSGVDISSSIPHLLANFSSLRSINLRNCLLQNEFPASILELPKLKILNVAYNTNLSGSFPEFSNNSLIEHMDLRMTGFLGIVPESISNLIHLTFLRLTECSFSGHIPGSLSNLTQLKALGLGSNKFTGFVPSLVSLSNLNILELNGNKFEKTCLPNWLGKLTKLTDLYVYDMNINGEIPPFFANLTELGIVAMGYNSLIGRVPTSFFNLTQLRMLDLRANQLQGPISSSFSNFESIQYLSLQFNNFSGRVDLDIFLGLNKLERLGLGENHISLLPTNNYTNNTLPELKYLHLASCNLKEFPAFLRFQKNIRALIFNDNKIDGLIPVWIWNNSKETLQVFDLAYNSITGFHQHPRFIKWERLEGFFIQNNRVRGQLPIPPQTIVVYDVSNNNMSGEIPPLLCEMKSLQQLDLSSNNMSGTLPSCFNSLINSLLDLNLGRNNFNGTLTNSFMHGSCLLKSIDLSENGFMGQLPRSLKNCTNLEILSLGDNSFDDVFPSWLGTLSKLQVLVLRSNKFYGPIQGSTADSPQFSKLRIIDLSNNDFSGQLDQKYFTTWNAMKSVGESSSVMQSDISFASGVLESKSPYSLTLIHKGVRIEYQKILTIFTAIDLSCNNFEGEIPLSLQDLRGLEALNLSNNHFTGSVLPTLGNLKNLESLDLSRNKLSGEIPQQLVELGFLSIFNVSFNRLDGRIPQGKQFDTFEDSTYEGNPGLCGKPLSKECGNSKESRLPPASNTSESLLPSERIDWIIILSGVVSGLVIGIVIGNLIHTNSDQFTKTKDRWVRPLRNMQRNGGTAIR